MRNRSRDRQIAIRACQPPNGLLAGYRDECQRDNRRRTFNLTRSAAQAFLRDFVGRTNRLWKAVAEIQRLKEAPRRGNPQSVAQVRGLARELGSHGSTLWALCLTGMRAGEYWGDWEVRNDRIMVHGTKTACSDRFVPLAFPILRPATKYWGFVQALRKATGGHVRVHDARKTYAHWLESAGIPRTRRRLYLGHGRRDITDLYEERDVRDFLSSDAQMLRGYVGGEPETTLKVVTSRIGA